MDESSYLRLADDAFKHIESAFEDVDPDVVDCERAGDVLTLTFANGKKCVVNTQRPVRQMWLAANARAWHFSWDEATKRWLDDKGSGDELFAVIARVVESAAPGVELALDRADRGR